MAESSFGWVLRMLHANGASFLFFFMFCHTARGVYFFSFLNTFTWFSGVTMLIVFMLVSFLGYVLPWGQISFWGATVITSLVGVVPYVGLSLIEVLWGGFSVSGPTLSRFFVLHFLIPWLSVILVLSHFFFLHSTGSSNPLGLPKHSDKIPFTPYFSVKDAVAFRSLFILFVLLVRYAPWVLGDPDNFIHASPLNTPLHIKPEWYFLFAYSILRCVPSKLGGVLGLLLSISILYFLPGLANKNHPNPAAVPLLLKTFMIKFVFTRWLATWLILTFLGGAPVEQPFFTLSQVSSVAYFFLLSLFSLIGSYLLSECRALNSPLFLHSRGLTPSSFTWQPRSSRAYQSFLFSTWPFPTQVKSDVKKWRSSGGLAVLFFFSLSFTLFTSSRHLRIRPPAATLPPVCPHIRWDVPSLTYPSPRNCDPEGEDWQSNATRTPPAEARGDGRW